MDGRVYSTDGLLLQEGQDALLEEKVLFVRMLMDWRRAGELWELYKGDPPSVLQKVLYKGIVQVRPTMKE